MDFYLDNIYKCVITKNKRSKRIRLSVKDSKTCKVSIPLYVPYKTAEKFIYQNREWIIHNIEKKKLHETNPINQILNKEDVAKITPALLDDITERLKYFNGHYNLKLNKVLIKRHQTLWGSCTKKGTLNFNYKLAYLEDDLKNYIIVHELCHLKEFNHSNKFWALVGETLPNYRALRARLKQIHNSTIN